MDFMVGDLIRCGCGEINPTSQPCWVTGRILRIYDDNFGPVLDLGDEGLLRPEIARLIEPKDDEAEIPL